MSSKPRTPARPKATIPTFDPVPVRPRHDGWTAQRQIGFITALAATGCVTQACASVGMATRSVYDLYNRLDAGSFRAAWRAATEHAGNRLASALLSRAIHGTTTPIFYKGEQVGERTVFDNRLGLTMLRHLVPERFGKWRDGMIVRRQDEDGAAAVFHRTVRDLGQDAVRDQCGIPRKRRDPVQTSRLMADPDEIAAEAEAKRSRDEMQRKIENAVYEERLAKIARGEIVPDDFRGDVA